MKTTATIIVAILLLIGCQSTGNYNVSSQADTENYAYVDLNRALNECLAGKRAIKLLEEAVKEKQKIILEKEVVIKKLDEEIALLHSPGVLKGKQAQREELLNEYNEFVKKAQNEVQTLRQKTMNTIIARLKNMLNDMFLRDQTYNAIYEYNTTTNKIDSVIAGHIDNVIAGHNVGNVNIRNSQDMTNKLIDAINEDSSFLAYIDKTVSGGVSTDYPLVSYSSVEPPKLTYVYSVWDNGGNNIFDGGEKVEISVTVKNDGDGEAKDVSVQVEGYNLLVKLLGGRRILGDIPAGSKKKAVFATYIPAEIEPIAAELIIRVKEGRGYSPTEVQSFTIAMKPAQTREIKQVISQLIDVNIIPSKISDYNRKNSYAVVIGISNYRDELIPDVKYAKSDAEIFAKYLENVGGVPRKNIKLLTDNRGAFSDLTSYIEEWLPRRVKKGSEVFIYYAGHGTPDPVSGEAYLVPYDGHPDFRSKLYPLKRMYASLNKLPSEQVVVMLDSCFSGAGGRSIIAEGTRPITLSIENPVLAGGKIAVLAASSGSQISSDYDRVKHGLFTYFLLKGMKGDADNDKNGRVELGELYNFINEHVSETASIELNRDQTPVLLPDLKQNGHGKIEITRVR